MGLAAARNASTLLNQNRDAYSPKERALIDTMLLRYPEVGGNQTKTYEQYSRALHELRSLDSTGLEADPDLMTFDAEASMVLQSDSAGYHFYTPQGDTMPPVEASATALLRSVLAATNQSHPYAQHLLIHSTEMSNSDAETAVQVAAHLQKQLAGLQDQHLQHMSSHTFFRTGHYHEAVTSNMVAHASDEAFLQNGMVPYGPGHDSVFLVCAALWGGERARAYQYAAIAQSIFAAAPSRPDGPDGSTAWNYPMIVAVRFGDWASVQQLDAVPPGDFANTWMYGYGVLRHFALALAATHLSDWQGASAHLQLLQELSENITSTASGSSHAQLAQIASLTATGALARAQGDLQQAVSSLTTAVELEMDMAYTEPPQWLLPTRECLGQALVEANQLDDAEHLFRQTLYGYDYHAEPNSGRAFLGLRKSLELQQVQNYTASRAEEIHNLTSQIDAAWQYSDVPLTTPCLHLSDWSQTVLMM
jgi:tetratricopeptide (TPR) repeat protein